MNRPIISVGALVFYLGIHYVVTLIMVTLINQFLNFIFNSLGITSLIFTTLVYIIISGLIIFFTYKLNILLVFRKHQISKENIPTLLTSIVAIFVIITVIFGAIQYRSKMSTISQEFTSKDALAKDEEIISTYHSTQEVEEYYSLKNENFTTAQSELSTMVISLTIGQLLFLLFTIYYNRIIFDEFSI